MKAFFVKYHVAMLRVGALIAAPAGAAFVDYLVNSASPFSQDTLRHAGLAAVLVALVDLKQWVASQVAASQGGSK